MLSNVNSSVSASGTHKKQATVTTEWHRVAQSGVFQELIRQKRSFIVSSTIFFIVFYFTLPVLTAFTTVLNGKAIGAVTWAYVYAFAQFVMTWGLCHLYVKKAKRFDEQIEKLKQEIMEKGGKVT
ncbi:DUF485 domain-containing protein [Effusibacillus consociatus]|uniref:DUF485 domain-containing protein n=1 Tax=Effusibacillus consociatus TaxID=1117041 RepID=A0ABV9Q7Q6_9BACL